MSTAVAARNKSLTDTLNRLITMSVDTYYNPYQEFQWPDSLPEKQWWMSPELLTVAGTRFFDALDEERLMALSKWESIHFYSQNVHGIRELLLEVIHRIHTPGFEVESEFFHHFVGEENEHMWFFATFCNKYGKKIYPDRKLKMSVEKAEADIESFLVFNRILIFEEIIDYFNVRMGRDETLHPIIRQVNAIHHQDESRHIAFGREIVRQLYEPLVEKYPPPRIAEVEAYLKRYVKASIESLYNPWVYRDAGLADPHKVRTELLADPARQQKNREVLKRTMDFYTKSGILKDEELS